MQYTQLRDADITTLVGPHDHWKAAGQQVSRAMKVAEGLRKPARGWTGESEKAAGKVVGNHLKDLEAAQSQASAVALLLVEGMYKFGLSKIQLNEVLAEVALAGMSVSESGRVEVGLLDHLMSYLPPEMFTKQRQDLERLAAVFTKRIADIVAQAGRDDKMIAAAIRKATSKDPLFNFNSSAFDNPVLRNWGIEKLLLAFRMGYGGHFMFRDGDDLTEMVKTDPFIANALKTIAEQIGTDDAGGTIANSMGKLKLPQRLMRMGTDMASVPLDALEDLGLGDGGKVHKEVAFLGSYELKWKVVDENPDGTVDVQCTIENPTTTESAIRNPISGYTGGDDSPTGPWQPVIKEAQTNGASMEMGEKVVKQVWDEGLKPLGKEVWDNGLSKGLLKEVGSQGWDWWVKPFLSQAVVEDQPPERQTIQFTETIKPKHPMKP